MSELNCKYTIEQLPALKKKKNNTPVNDRTNRFSTVVITQVYYCCNCSYNRCITESTSASKK